jgi:hypothetical protein
LRSRIVTAELSAELNTLSPQGQRQGHSLNSLSID